MKKNFLSTLLMLITALVFSACSTTTTSLKKDDTEAVKPISEPEMTHEMTHESQGEAIAVINGEKILRSDFDNIMKMYSGEGGKFPNNVNMDEAAMKSMRKRMLEQMIDGELLYQAAREYPVEGIDKLVDEKYANVRRQYKSDEEFAKVVAENGLTPEKLKNNLKKNLMIQNFIDNKILADIEVSDGDVKAYYDSNVNKFETPPQIKASHILIKLDNNAAEDKRAEAMEKVKRVKESLNQGEDFAEAAKRLSEGPSAPRGGDLGYFGRGMMVKPFEDAAFALQPGEVSDVVETQFGYHIIKVFDKKPETVRTFEEAKSEIEESMKREKFQGKLNEFIDAKKSEAKIEIFDQ